MITYKNVDIAILLKFEEIILIDSILDTARDLDLVTEEGKVIIKDIQEKLQQAIKRGATRETI